MAVANYHSTYGSYPPPFTTDENGQRLHSWRVLILPFLEQQQLYADIHLDEPWDSPANRQVADQMPRVYAFHGEYTPTITDTNYFAVVGRETFWPPEGERTHADLIDDPASTIMLVENDGYAVGWMDPRDIEADQMKHSVPHPEGISSNYLRPAVVMADGTLVRLEHGHPEDVLRGMLTINGGENLKREGETWVIIKDGRDRAIKRQ